VNKDHAVGFGIGLLTGAVIGGVVALLYAPQSGKETRKLVKDKTGEIVTAVREKTEDVIDSVKDAASEAGRRGQAAVHALKG
jgi:gas vesicle protein